MHPRSEARFSKELEQAGKGADAFFFMDCVNEIQSFEIGNNSSVGRVLFSVGGRSYHGFGSVVDFNKLSNELVALDNSFRSSSRIIS